MAVTPKPAWLKVRAPGGETYQHLKQTFRRLDLYTVCEEAMCPNVGECWRDGTATVMLLGDTCTRGCRFCAVTTGNPRGAVDVREPEHVARAITQLALHYVVLTMVDRDDLLDGGAQHVATTVERIRTLRPDILVETLVGDFQGHLEPVATVLSGGPQVYAHNIETVRRTTRTVRDVRCSYDQSLRSLEHAKRVGPPDLVTKSSIMVGIGERDDEVLESLRDLRSVGVDIVTLGQYLRPTPKHHEVTRFVPPEQFDEYARAAREMGFLYAASGPLVRSSYRAAEVFLRGVLRADQGGSASSVEQALAARGERARALAAQRQQEELASAPGASPSASMERPTLLPVESLIRRGTPLVVS